MARINKAILQKGRTGRRALAALGIGVLLAGVMPGLMGAGCSQIPGEEGKAGWGDSPAVPVKEVVVDVSQVTGTFRSMYGVNAGPDGAAAAYRDAGVEYVRLHDAGGHSDYHQYTSIYDAEKKRFDRSFNPFQPSDYDWGALDKDLAAIVDNGMQPFFRLGISWPREGIPVKPPLDPDGKGFTRFAELCRHTLMHYNQGWDEGYEYGICYWEVWNEPDGRFWKGSPEQFYELYAATARALKEQDPSIKVGGPGATPGVAVAHRSAYCQDFLAACQAADAPLDFYSWHLYSVYNPYLIKGCAEYVREALDAAGYEEAESIISEINLSLGQSGDEDLDSAKGAAYVASALLTAQESPVDMLLWYRGNKFMNLFEEDRAGQAVYTWNGLGYKAVQAMVGAAPLRLEASGSEVSTEDNGKDSENFMAAAGLSEDQKDVYIVISNYYSKNTAVEVKIKGLEAGEDYEVSRFLVQEPDARWEEHCETITADETGLIVPIDDLAAPSVCLLRVHAGPDQP